jgi:hypothetical protein
LSVGFTRDTSHAELRKRAHRAGLEGRQPRQQILGRDQGGCCNDKVPVCFLGLIKALNSNRMGNKQGLIPNQISLKIWESCGGPRLTQLGHLNRLLRNTLLWIDRL